MGAGETVLIVEDYEDTRSLLRMLLEARGYRVLEASDGQEAIEIVEVHSPDLILMDLSLPWVDGLTATRIIHENEKCRHIPVIAVTAHPENSYREIALEAGCVDFVPKPVDFVLLHEIISAQLSRL